jgi:hypothetical protein
MSLEQYKRVIGQEFTQARIVSGPSRTEVEVAFCKGAGSASITRG